MSDANTSLQTVAPPAGSSERKKKKKKEKGSGSGSGSHRKRHGHHGHKSHAARREAALQAAADRAAFMNKKVWRAPVKELLKALVQGRVFQPKDFKYGPCLGKGSIAHVRLVTLKQQGQAEQDFQVPIALKIMSKADVIEAGQVDSIKRERMILERLSSPYVVTFLGSFQDTRRVIVLLEYVHGGDLYSHLKKNGRLPIDQCKFYATHLTLALKYLHFREVVYRDMKPDNILIANSGNIRLTDFGFAKELKDGEETHTIVGTPEYLAPEIILSQGHLHSCDFWALGIVVFEMVTGYPPFWDHSPYQIYNKIVEFELNYPRHFDVCARDLLTKGLLIRDKRERFHAIDVMMHPWFNFVDWGAMMEFNIEPPHRPNVDGPMDTRYFELLADDECRDRFQDARPIMKRDNKQFDIF